MIRVRLTAEVCLGPLCEIGYGTRPLNSLEE